jgi:hypothetical protein
VGQLGLLHLAVPRSEVLMDLYVRCSLMGPVELDASMGV